MWSVKMQSLGERPVRRRRYRSWALKTPAPVLQSQFLVSADRFAIVNTIAGGAISVPFAVQNGQVFMNSAFIADGTITNAEDRQLHQLDQLHRLASRAGFSIRTATLEINGIVPGQGRLVINALNVFGL
jgi:hypothetical protein